SICASPTFREHHERELLEASARSSAGLRWMIGYPHRRPERRAETGHSRQRRPCARGSQFYSERCDFGAPFRIKLGTAMSLRGLYNFHSVYCRLSPASETTLSTTKPHAPKQAVA